MDFNQPEDFYKVYDEHRAYVISNAKKKHMNEFRRNIWEPAEFKITDRVLELGCGVGMFISFLKKMGVENVIGVEMDVKVSSYMPDYVKNCVIIQNFDDFFCSSDGLTFDKIVLLDVFEHFSPADAVRLLCRLKNMLTANGRVVLRMPNMSSPYGLQYQYNDLTHKGFYAPGNIRQLGMAAQFDCVGNFSYRRGSFGRRLTNLLLEKIGNAFLSDPPPIWTANFVSVLKPKA